MEEVSSYVTFNYVTIAVRQFLPSPHPLSTRTLTAIMKPSLIFLSDISYKKQKTIRDTYIIKSPTFIKENDNSFLML